MNCSWEEGVAGWLEYTMLDGSRDTRSLAGQKVVGNDMQPILTSSMGGAELLGSRRVTYLVSMQKKSGIVHPLPTIREEWMSCTPSSRPPHLAVSTLQRSVHLQQRLQERIFPVTGKKSQTASGAQYSEQKHASSIFPPKGILCHHFCFLIQ